MLVVLSLMACGGAYLNDELACEHDVFDWWEDDYATLIDQGARVDGAANQLEWRFDSVSEYQGVLLGKYNALSGAYESRINYLPGYYLKYQETDPDYDSYGTVFRNGNVDMRVKMVVEDQLGERFSYIRRDVRKGCEGTQSTRHEQDDGTLPKVPDTVLDYTIVSPDEIRWQGTRVDSTGVEQTGQGTWTSDGKRISTWNRVDGDDVSTTTRTRRTNGSLLIETTGDQGNGSAQSRYSWYSGMERKFDGQTREEHVTYAYTTDVVLAEYTFERDLEGVGTGSAAYDDGTTCDLTFNGWDDCTWSCSDGSSDTYCPARPSY